MSSVVSGFSRTRRGPPEGGHDIDWKDDLKGCATPGCRPAPCRLPLSIRTAPAWIDTPSPRASGYRPARCSASAV